jgi:hypothetical protein
LFSRIAGFSISSYFSEDEMCSNPLVDLEVLYRVRLAAPKPATHSPTEAKLLLRALVRHSTLANLRQGLDEQPYWRVLLGDIQADLPEALSPKRAGLLARAMGLSMVRVKDGFTVLWSKEQLDLLCKYSDVKTE